MKIIKKFYRIVFTESEIIEYERIVYVLYNTTLAIRRIFNNLLF